MAKPSKTSKAEVKEVEVQKIDNRISLESILEQVSKKAGTQIRSRSVSSATKDRATRIKELSAELAREIREFQGGIGGFSIRQKRPEAALTLLYWSGRREFEATTFSTHSKYRRLSIPPAGDKRASAGPCADAEWHGVGILSGPGNRKTRIRIPAPGEQPSCDVRIA